MIYSTEANAPSALGLNIMVNQIPVTNWLTNTIIDNTPKKYQKLKFFGATCLSRSSIDTVVDALLEERCSYLVAAPQNFDVSRALKVGWSGELSEDLSFFGCVFQLGGLVLKLIGEFDDFESGFVSVGSPEVVGRLLD